jgi:hypothetical protein
MKSRRGKESSRSPPANLMHKESNQCPMSATSQ